VTGYTTEQALNYYHNVSRRKMLDYLGGSCVECGVTENLHIDHVDPATKSFAIRASMSMKRPEVMAELDKCQLLCRPHHEEKTAREHTGFTHGTMYAWMKMKCSCEVCAPVKRAYNDARNAKRRTGKRGPYKPRQ
jgi:hypothetical protein